MKPKEKFIQVPEFHSHAHAHYALRHVAAVVRENAFVFVTKTQANLLGKPDEATYALTAENMKPYNVIYASGHFVDVEQTDIDLISVVVAYWKHNKGPDYLQKSIGLMDSTVQVNNLPTLALLVYEYLKQLNLQLSIADFSKPIMEKYGSWTMTDTPF